MPSFTDTSKYQTKKEKKKASFTDTKKYQITDTSKYQEKSETKPTSSKKLNLIDAIKKGVSGVVSDIKQGNFGKAFDTLNTPTIGMNRVKNDPITATAKGFINSATLGAVKNSGIEEAKKSNPIASTVGEFAGYSLPFNGATKLVKPITKGLKIAKGTTKIGKIANKAIQTSAEGFGSGAIIGGAESAIRGDSASDVAKNSLVMGGFGAGANLAIPLVGKGISKVIQRVRPKTVSEPIARFNPFEQQRTLTEPSVFNKPNTPTVKFNAKTDTNILPSSKYNVVESVKANKPQPKATSKLTNRLNPSDTTLMLDNLRKAGLSKEEVINEIKSKIKAIEDEHFNFLKVNKNGTKNYDRGAIKHSDGSYTRYSVTDNPEWYSDFYKTYGRKPTNADLKNLTKEHLENGFQHYGDVPANDSYLALKKELADIEKAGNKSFSIDLSNMPTTKVYSPKSQGLKEINFPSQINEEAAFTSLETPSQMPITPQGTKTSKFYSNSLMQGNALTEEGKKALDEAKFAYEYKPNEQSISRAQASIDANGIDNEATRLMQNGLNSAEDSMGHHIITKDLMDKALQSKDYSSLNNFLETTRPSITDSAQMIQALSQFKKSTPEGALMNAHGVVESVQKAIKKDYPNKFKDADNMIANMSYKIDDVDKEISNSLTNEELLADRISSTLSETQTPKNDIEKNMINTLFSIAKKDLPEKVKNISDPLKFVSEAIQNRNQYNDVWNKTKQMLTEKYKNDSEKLAMLDDYFNRTLRPVYNQNKLNQAIANELKSKGIDLSEIVKQHYSVGSQLRTDLKQTLIEKAGLTGQDAEYLAQQINNRMKELTKAKKEQILKQMFKDRPKPKQKLMIDKILELQNVGGFSNNNYKQLVYDKLGIPTLSSEDARFISETMTKAQSLEGDAKEEAIALVMKLIGDKIPASVAQKVQALQRISLLLNTKTMGRNVLGNVILGGLENTKDLIGTPLDIAIAGAKGIAKTEGGIVSKLKGGVESIKGGERTTTIFNPFTQAKGFYKGGKRVIRDSRLGIDTSPTRGQYDLPQGRTFDNPILNALDKATKTGLRLGDDPFYQAAYDDRLNQLMKFAKVAEPTEAMVKEATELAENRTLQNNSNISKGFKWIQQGLNSLTGSKDIGIGSFAIPFTKTPANILDKALDYSPVGFARAVNELKKVKGGTFNQKAFVDKISRGITGTALIKFGYDLAGKGLLMGEQPKDKDVANMYKQAGKNPYSIKYGDKYYTIDWAQPAAVPLMIGADLFHQGKTSDDVKEVVYNAVKSGGTTLFKQSLLQGMQRLFGGYTPLQGVEDVVKSVPSQFMPSGLKQVTQALDKTQRENYSPTNQGDIVNAMRSKTPLSKGMYPKLDSLGREVENYQGKNTPFNIMLNPLFVTEDKTSEGEKMILDIYDKTGIKTHFPRVAPKNIKGKALSEQQFYELQKEMGTKTNEFIQKLASNPNFNKSTMTEKEAEYRAKYIENALSDIFNNAKHKVLPQDFLKKE